MLNCRRWGVDRVNDMFGTNIRVSLASAWEDNQQELEAEQEETTETEETENENESNTSDTE